MLGLGASFAAPWLLPTPWRRMRPCPKTNGPCLRRSRSSARGCPKDQSRARPLPLDGRQRRRPPPRLRTALRVRPGDDRSRRDGGEGRLCGVEALAGREAALWLAAESITPEHAGEPLSRNEVRPEADTGEFRDDRPAESVRDLGGRPITAPLRARRHRLAEGPQARRVRSPPAASPAAGALPLR